jgi:hypothetical protein
MATYYNLAHAEKPLESTGNYFWPYDIDICFDDVPYPIAFSEGVAHGEMGCTVSASTALEPQWHSHFENTRGEWLLPYIRNSAAGDPFPREEMLSFYKQKHQEAPRSYELKK